MSISSGDRKPPHVALLPSAGMGHINPFNRLAAALVNRGCTVSYIAAQPTVSRAESLAISRLLDSFPKNIHCINLPLVELDPSKFPPTTDPFTLRFEAILRSAHLLPPLLTAASVPISALIVDIVSASTFIPIGKALNLPCYVLSVSSAAMLSLVAYFPTHIARSNGVEGDIDIPGLCTIPKSSIPRVLREPNKHLFGIQFIENGRMLVKSDGILVNTFQEFEPKAISALNGGLVAHDLPPVFPIGPLCPLQSDKNSSIQWLDQQPDKSVVYVCFGNLIAMKEEQIDEIGVGLEKSGQRFLWVIKTKKVDREEKEVYTERVKGRGLVINGWVEQEEILSHRAVGLFVSHCGWNSLTEAAMSGTRVLGWPMNGDHRVNAGVLRRSGGLGVWMEEWCWEEEGTVVTGDEIAKRVKEMMEDEGLKKSAARVGEEARRAVGAGGSSEKGFGEFIATLMG